MLRLILSKHVGKGKETKAGHRKSCHGQHIGQNKGFL